MARSEIESRRFLNWILRASWVYAYACLIAMFEVLRRIEGARCRGRTTKSVG